MIRYATICSGIEAPSVAWKTLNWNAAWFSEIEPFPCAVLKHHHPKVPNLGDITKITEEQVYAHGPIDLVCGGTPCQSFSVAGLRRGLGDPRGNLALRFLQLVGAIRPRWVLWENIPGVRSSWTGPEPPRDLEKGQRWESTEASDFGCFLEALGQLGYGWAYRSLDAQYCHLAQRRERVFVVGYFGDWRRASAVLLERDSLSGHSAMDWDKDCGPRGGTMRERLKPDGWGRTGTIPDDLVREIRKGCNGQDDRRFAEMLGRTQRSIREIRQERRYRHVKDFDQDSP